MYPREFNDVRKIVGYTKLLAINPIGKIINVCSGQAHTLGKNYRYHE